MLEFLYSDKFDEEIALRDEDKFVTRKELKQYIFSNLSILNSKKENVVILPDDILSFTVNFFASILTHKKVYLVDDVNKIRKITADTDILESCVLDLTEPEQFPEVDCDEVIINLMTSGSSGGGKCIKKSLTNLINEAKDINKTFKFDNNFTVTSTTTPGHLFGLTFGFMFPLCNHYTIYTKTIEYPDLYNVENSFLVSTPSFLDIFRKNNLPLKGVKYVVSAGSKLKDNTFEYIEKYSKVIEIYGSTETGIMAHREHFNEKYLTKFENVKIKLFEDSAVVSSPYAYEEQVEIGDKIEIDGEKILLKNRTDRLLKIQEKRISAEELENYLNKNELVTEAYCFKNQEKIACLCALSDEGKKQLLKTGIAEHTIKLKRYLKSEFELIPQRWKFIDEIPKTKTGKIDKEFIEHIFGINISFPVILEREKSINDIKLKFYFHKNCDFYSGHFPDYPITPGVVQLYLASFWGEKFYGKSLSAGQIRRIKFNNIIEADSIVDLKLISKGDNICFEYSDGNKIFSSGVFSCENIFKGVV